MSKILVTGGCGFIGHHFVESLLKNTDLEVVVFDNLTYAANGFDRLRDIQCFDEKRVHMFALDITRPIPTGVLQETKDVEYIVHMAAETHVDNSIVNPEPFVMTNVVGTMRMLDYARKLKGLQLFIQFGTDEIFGPCPPNRGGYREDERFNSCNPYAASKAGAEELANAYANTYGLPVIMTHTMNVVGERQHPEKFVPSTIRKVRDGETVIIHADKTLTVPGSRFYIHAREVSNALLFLLGPNQSKGRYNIVGEQEWSNLRMAQRIANTVGKPLKYELVDFHSSRPGHDLRYALDGYKMEAKGWKPSVHLEDSLAKTVQWFLDNPAWLEIPQCQTTSD